MLLSSKDQYLAMIGSSSIPNREAPTLLGLLVSSDEGGMPNDKCSLYYCTFPKINDETQKIIPLSLCAKIPPNPTSLGGSFTSDPSVSTFSSSDFFKASSGSEMTELSNNILIYV